MRLALPLLASLASLAALGSAGCAATQQFVMLPSPPSRDAPLAERDAYYEVKKPVGIAGMPNGMNQMGWLVPQGFPILVLADGTKVSDPTSLMPAVDVESRTAEAARKVGDLKLFSNSVYTVSTLGFGVGFAAIVLAPALVNADPTVGITLAVLGLGGTVGGAFGLAWAIQLADEAEAEKMTALLLYEGDLRRRLALVRPDEVLEKKWVAPAPRVRPPAPASPSSPSSTGAPEPEPLRDPSQPPPLLEEPSTPP